MKTTAHFAQKLCALIGTFALFIASASAGEDGNAPSLADTILNGGFLDEPILWIGDQPPIEKESQQLLDVLNHLDQPDWTTKLEKFILAHPESPWVPGVRSALAVMYRQM